MPSYSWLGCSAWPLSQCTVQRSISGPGPFATAVAAIWVAHPLGADAVAYATQRSTLLASGCLLLALLATLRSHRSPRGGRWWALCVLAMALALASKEDMVTGPVLVVLFDRGEINVDRKVDGGTRRAGPLNAGAGWRARARVCKRCARVNDVRLSHVPVTSSGERPQSLPDFPQ